MGALLHLTKDAEAVNAVVNHPAVRPSCGLVELGELDFSEVLSRPENLCLMGEHGGFLLLWSAPRVRELHVFLLPEGRGQWGFNACPEVVDHARAHGAQMLWARIDPAKRHLAMFSRIGGMKPTGEKIETFGVVYDVYCMEVH